MSATLENMSHPSEQWADALKAVLAKAATDADFRALCLADPAAAVHEVAGVDGPAGLRFTEAPDGEGIVLPRLGGGSDDITDSEVLASAAGGGATGLPSLGDRPRYPGEIQNCQI